MVDADTILSLTQRVVQSMRRQRIFRDRLNPLDPYDDSDLRRRYRFDKSSICFLCNLLEKYISPSTDRNRSIPTVVQTCIALRYFATGTMQLGNGDLFGVSQSSCSRIIDRVSSSLCNQKVIKHFIKFPTDTETVQKIQSEFHGIASFPSVVGAIDGTHIRIVAPHDFEEVYVNRKNYHSINVQVVMDSSCRILDLVAKWPGATHDARILKESGIFKLFENGQISACYLLGDSGYPCKRWLMTPYLRPENAAEERYNSSHKRTRNVVERGIGQWKRRFHVLHGEIRLLLSRSCKVVTSCGILHNFAKDRNMPLIGEDDDAAEDETNTNNTGHFPEHLPQDGGIHRAHLTRTYFSLPFWTSHRFRLAVLFSFGLLFTYSHKADLSLAMVCMVNDTVENDIVTSGNNSSLTNNTEEESQHAIYSDDPHQNTTELCSPSSKKKLKGGQFKWSKELQGIILGAFFWGYLTLQIPGAWMALRFGAKRIVAIGILSTSVLNVTTPWCARASPYLLIANRVLLGVGESMVIPAGQTFLLRWSPTQEKSLLLGIAYAGPFIGTAVMFPVSGVLCDYGLDGGWPSIFYLFGGLGIIWVSIWMMYAHDSPNETPRLDNDEKHFLEKNVPSFVTDKSIKTPWRKMLLSASAWACILPTAFMDYGINMMLTQLPTYMNEILQFEIVSNGLFLALPYIALSLCTTLTGYISDKLIETKTLSKKWTRKVIAIVGFVLPAVLLVVIGTLNCSHQEPAVAILVVLVAFAGVQLSLIVVIYTDIAGVFSGILFSIGVELGAVAGIVAPYVVAAITTNKTREEWMIAFIIAACVSISAAIVYCGLARFEVQPWATCSDIQESQPKSDSKDTDGSVWSIS